MSSGPRPTPGERMKTNSIDLRQLRYFVAVAEELNFERAGKRLGICSPPLCVQMRRLQDYLGVELLRIHRRKLQLTAEGRLFLAEARNILSAAEDGVARVRRAAEADSGRLTVACDPLFEFGILPEILVAFRRARPKVEFALRSLRTQQQIAELAMDRLDVGFVCSPIDSDEVDLTELCQQPLIALIPKKHPLSELTAISFEALSGTPLIVYSRALDPHTFDQIGAEFQRAGAQMEVGYEVESPLLMIGMIAAGHGCGIAPKSVSGFKSGAIVCKPLAASQLGHTLGIVKRRNRKGLAAMFCDFVEHDYGVCIGPTKFVA